MAVMTAMTRSRDLRLHLIACDTSCRHMTQPASVSQELADVQQGVIRRPGRDRLCRPDMSRCVSGGEKPAVGKPRRVRAVKDTMFAVVSAARDKSRVQHAGRPPHSCQVHCFGLPQQPHCTLSRSLGLPLNGFGERSFLLYSIEQPS